MWHPMRPYFNKSLVYNFKSYTGACFLVTLSFFKWIGESFREGFKSISHS